MSLQTPTDNSEPTIEVLQLDILNLRAQNEALQEHNKKLMDRLQWIEEQLRLGKHQQFAKQSETARNLTLFDADEADEVTETVTPSDDDEEEWVTIKRNTRKGSQRNIDTKGLPRETVIHDLAPEDKVCSCCQGELHKIGEDKSEKIDYIPAQLKVIEHVTIKYGCRCCESVKAAKKPESLLPKSMATDHFIADVVIKKYDEHLPLYRQSKILERDGIVIPDNTLGNWVMGAADALLPLGEALWRQVISSQYLQADETRVKILKPDKTGYMWVYQGLDSGRRFVMLEFSLTRSAEVPERRLNDFSGLLQTDGYVGYKQIGQREGVTHLGCWDHCRRRFADCLKATGKAKAGVAAQCLKLINGLYKIEREIKGASVERRHAVRQARAVPILDELYSVAKKLNALPKSLLGVAIGYLKNHEPYLRCYVDHGQAHISNCLTENVIRPLALGRKNWMFVGNEDCANKAALLYSLIQTCKLNGINVRAYLNYVFSQAHALRRGEVTPESLLPQFIDVNFLK